MSPYGIAPVGELGNPNARNRTFSVGDLRNRIYEYHGVKTTHEVSASDLFFCDLLINWDIFLAIISLTMSPINRRAGKFLSRKPHPEINKKAPRARSSSRKAPYARSWEIIQYLSLLYAAFLNRAI